MDNPRRDAPERGVDEGHVAGRAVDVDGRHPETTSDVKWTRLPEGEDHGP